MIQDPPGVARKCQRLAARQHTCRIQNTLQTRDHVRSSDRQDVEQGVRLIETCTAGSTVYKMRSPIRSVPGQQGSALSDKLAPGLGNTYL